MKGFKSAFLLLFPFLFLTLFTQIVKGDVLNDYLKQKTFGANPGPCPTQGSCNYDVNVNELNPNIQNRRVCLIKNYCAIPGGFFGCIYEVNLCATIKEWFEDGTLQLWNLRCKNVALEGLSMTQSGTSTTQNVNPAADEIKLACTGKVRFIEFTLEYSIALLDLTGNADFSTSAAQGFSYFDVALQFRSSNFQNSFPTSVVFPGGEANACDIFIGSNMNLALQNGKFEKIKLTLDILGFDPTLDGSFLPQQAIIDFFVPLMEAAFGQVMCDLIDASMATNGDLNIMLNDFREFILEKGASTGEDINIYENNPNQPNKFPGITNEKIQKSTDFRSDQLLEIVSVGLNGWLGQSIDGDLVINEFVTNLLGNNGAFEFDLDASETNLVTSLAAKITDFVFQVKQFSMSGLNTITEFKLLENNFAEGTTPADRRKYTLDHSLSLSEISFDTTMSVKLVRGEWVTASECGTVNYNNPTQCTLDQKQFDFTMGMTWKDFSVDASSFTVVQPDLLDDVQLGQLFGQDFSADALEGAKRVLKCMAPMFHAAYLPQLSISIGQILEDITVEIPNSVGLGDLVENSAKAFNHMFTSVLRVNAPGLVQSMARPEANQFLKDNVVAVQNLDQCPNYVPGNIAAADTYFKFNDGLLANIFPVINNVLGNFEVDGNTDMNDLIQVLLEYFSANYEDFPLQPAGNEQGDWELKEGDLVLMDLPGFETTDAQPRYIQLHDFTITNLNTIYELNSAAYQDSPFGFSMDFAFGREFDVDNSMLYGVDTTVALFDAQIQHGSTEPNRPIDVTFKTTLELKEIDLSIDLQDVKIKRDLVYQLKFKQIGHTPCLGSTIEDAFNVAESSLLADIVFIRLDVTDNAPISPAHPFVDALHDLSDAVNGLVSPRFKAMTNTILDNGLRHALSLIHTEGNDINPQNCLDFDDPLGNIFSVFTGIDLPDFADTVTECIAPITDPILTPEELEAQLGLTAENLYFDFEDSFIIRQIQKTFGTNTEDADRNKALTDIVFLLANQSGTPLADAFFLENITNDDGTVEEVASFQIDTSTLNFIFKLFDIEPIVFDDSTIVPGFHFEASSVVLRGISRFVGRTKIMEVISSFITKHTLAFGERKPLIVEVHGYMEADNSFIGESAPGKVVEEYTITTTVLDFSLEVELFAAINTEIFGNLSLGSFIEVTAGDLDFILTDYAFDCLLASVYEGGMFLPNINLEIGNLNGPTLTTTGNFLSPELAAVMDEGLRVGTQMYIDALPRIAYNCLRTAANEGLQRKWEASQNDACPKTNLHVGELPEEDQIFRFGTSKGLQRLQTFFDENLRANNYELWNQMIDTLVDGATLWDDGSYIGVEDATLVYQGVEYGLITAKATNVIFDDVNFTAMHILEPVPDNVYTARTSFQLSEEKPLKIEFRYLTIAKDVFVDTDVLQNDLLLKFDISNWNVGLDLYMELNVSKALDIRFSSISSFDELPCLLTPFRALDPTDFNFTTDKIRLRLSCAEECEFPLFDRLLGLGGEIDTENEEGALLSEMLDQGVGFLVDFIEGSGIQTLIDTQLSEAGAKCDELIGAVSGITDFEPSDDDLDAATFMGYAFLGFLFACAFSICALFPLHNRRLKKKLAEFSTGRKTMSEEKELELFKLSMKSLFMHPATPKVAKFAVPLVTVLHIFGLVVAIVFSGAMDVIIAFTVFGATTNDIVLVPFSIASTINDIWNSGGWYLALIIGLASCAWPVVKNAILTTLWFTPTTVMSARRRGKILIFLDSLGKWSLLDVFVVIMTLASLKTYLQLSAYSSLHYLPEETLNMEINVKPERGVILLLIIASSSLIINHIMHGYHEKSLGYVQKREDALRGVLKDVPRSAARKKAIFKHRFSLINKKGKVNAVKRSRINFLLATNIVGGLTLIAGIFAPVVTFELGGVFGALVGSVEGDLAVKTYSVFDLALLAGESPKDGVGDNLVLIFFQFILIASSLIFPFLLMVVNTVIVTRKMSLATLKSFKTANYICFFWSANECFMVAIILTLLEVDRIASYLADFVSGDFCSNFKSFLQSILGEQNGACINLEGRLEFGAFVVIIGVFAQLFATLYTTQLVQAVIEDRYYQAYNGARNIERPTNKGYWRRTMFRLLCRKVAAGGKKNRDNDGDGGSILSGFDMLDTATVAPGGNRDVESPPRSSDNPMYDGVNDAPAIKSVSPTSPLKSVAPSSPALNFEQNLSNAPPGLPVSPARSSVASHRQVAALGEEDF